MGGRELPCVRALDPRQGNPNPNPDPDPNTNPSSSIVLANKGVQAESGVARSPALLRIECRFGRRLPRKHAPEPAGGCAHQLGGCGSSQPGSSGVLAR